MKRFLILLLLGLNGLAYSQSLPPYKNESLPIDIRCKDLISRMTPEEKFWQCFMLNESWELSKERYTSGVFGFEGGESEAGANAQLIKVTEQGSAHNLAERINSAQAFFVKKTRLGIPIIPYGEALHGLIREGATSFPQSIALAATFDTVLMHRISACIAKESKDCGIRMILSPVVNISNDPRWGRTEETYGEDPCLSSLMGVAFVSEFEKAGIISGPKHFVANYGDGGRDSYPVHYDERMLEEIFFPPFKACIQKGGSRSVMASYNSLSGVPCTANNWLLNKKLKQEWKFEGFVISDAGATGGSNCLHMTAKDYYESTVDAMNNGLDVIFQTQFEHYKLFMPPFLDRSIRRSAIDSAVYRVLNAKFQLGLFDHPYVNTEQSRKAFGNPDHIQLALEAALESVVLLKNDNNILPLSKTIKSIAVIGPDAIEARLGGYSGPGFKKVSILEGIVEAGGGRREAGSGRQEAGSGRREAGSGRQEAGSGRQEAGGRIDNFEIGNVNSEIIIQNSDSGHYIIRYAQGCGREEVDYVAVPAEVLWTMDHGVKVEGFSADYYNNIDMSGEAALIRTDKNIDFRWTLYSPDPKINYDWFSVRWTGNLVSQETGQYKIGIKGNDGYRLYINDSLIIDNWQKTSFRTLVKDYYFTKGNSYRIRLEFHETSGSAWLRLIWNQGVQKNSDEEIEKAVQIAAKSDAIIMVAGIEEGEGLDRAMLSLPGRQEELILKLAALNKPFVVCLSGGSAVCMQNWIDKVPAILDIWYPGEQGGNAVAKILFGDYNPAGRLPISFPLTEGQLPLYYNHKPTGRNDDYSDITGEALFPFGYGLSYTTFTYSDLSIKKEQLKAGDSVEISFVIKNTGKIAGDEVPQLYIKDLLASVARPLKELKAFKRVHLEPGEEKTIRMMITPEMLSMFDLHVKQIVEAGEFRILIGASSKDIRLRGTIVQLYIR